MLKKAIPGGPKSAKKMRKIKKTRKKRQKRGQKRRKNKASNSCKKAQKEAKISKKGPGPSAEKKIPKKGTVAIDFSGLFSRAKKEAKINSPVERLQAQKRP